MKKLPLEFVLLLTLIILITASLDFSSEVLQNIKPKQCVLIPAMLGLAGCGRRA